MSHKRKQHKKKQSQDQNRDIRRAAHRAADITDEQDQGQNRYQKNEAGPPKSADLGPVFQPIPPELQIGGAYYLPMKADVPTTMEAIKKAWDFQESSDISINEEEFMGHGIQYVDDKYMLARTKIVKLEDKGMFLEINKMEGDGFLFADVFKPSFVEKLGDTVQDVQNEEAVEMAHQEDEDDMRYLDFSVDEESALFMMQKLLGALKPGKEIRYDNKLVFESVSTLGHNAPQNLSFIMGFQDHIVAPVLEILRHGDTEHMPTVFFGSKLIATLIRSEELDDDLKSWNNVVNIAEALKKHCLGEQAPKATVEGDPSLQVTKSRQSQEPLLEAIKTLIPLCKDEPSAKAVQTLTDIFGQLDEAVQTEMMALLPQA